MIFILVLYCEVTSLKSYLLDLILFINVFNSSTEHPVYPALNHGVVKRWRTLKEILPSLS